MRINGEAWPRAITVVAVLAATCGLTVTGALTETLDSLIPLVTLLVGAAIGHAAPAPTWTKRDPRGGKSNR